MDTEEYHVSVRGEQQLSLRISNWDELGDWNKLDEDLFKGVLVQDCLMELDEELTLDREKMLEYFKAGRSVFIQRSGISGSLSAGRSMCRNCGNEGGRTKRNPLREPALQRALHRRGGYGVVLVRGYFSRAVSSFAAARLPALLAAVSRFEYYRSYVKPEQISEILSLPLVEPYDDFYDEDKGGFWCGSV